MKRQKTDYQHFKSCMAKMECEKQRAIGKKVEEKKSPTKKDK